MKSDAISADESPTSSPSDSDSLPESIGVVSSLMNGQGFLVTKDKKTYMSFVRRGIPSFSWTEMLSLLDANPTTHDLEWALQVKKNCPGVRIDDIKKKKLTHPKTPIRLSDPEKSALPSPTAPPSE